MIKSEKFLFRHTNLKILRDLSMVDVEIEPIRYDAVVSTQRAVYCPTRLGHTSSICVPHQLVHEDDYTNAGSGSCAETKSYRRLHCLTQRVNSPSCDAVGPDHAFI